MFCVHWEGVLDYNVNSDNSIFIIPYQMVFLICYHHVQSMPQSISLVPIEQIAGICKRRTDFFRHRGSSEWKIDEKNNNYFLLVGNSSLLRFYQFNVKHVRSS